jgi:NAD(P)-dependent dehydrogenase (short-subunit alcohol dehydrogenase family)
MALHLARRGVGILITYNTRKDAADALRAEIAALGEKAAALQLDVTRSESYAEFALHVKAALAATWNRSEFDYLVNNAGMGVHASIEETTAEQFDQLVAAQLKAPFFLTKTLLPLMKDGGRIVNVSSGLTRFSYPGYAAYAMMKGGVEVFTRYLAKELGPRRIAVNTIAPGAIETDFGGGVVRDNAEINRMIAAQTALGRVGLPDDIGGAVAALLSDETGWINGQRIEVSGGVHL